MSRNEMILTLTQAAVAGKRDATHEEIKAYMEYLRTKSDLELQNMMLINCF